MEKEGTGSGARRGSEGFSDGGNADRSGRRRKKRRVDGEELGDLEAKVIQNFREEDVVNDGFVEVGAGGLNERSKETPFDMTVAPESTAAQSRWSRINLLVRMLMEGRSE